MPNFAGALKGEIRRLARKEVRASVMPLKKVVAGLRKRVAQQRKLITELERTAKRSIKHTRTAVTSAAEESQIRFSPAWVKKHRRKLNMSRRVYAQLVGVSAQSIFGWETGRSRPRRKALESWRKIRGMGVRELKAIPGRAKADKRRRRKPGRKRRAKPVSRRKRSRAGAARKRKSRARRMRRAA